MPILHTLNAHWKETFKILKTFKSHNFKIWVYRHPKIHYVELNLTYEFEVTNTNNLKKIIWETNKVLYSSASCPVVRGSELLKPSWFAAIANWSPAASPRRPVLHSVCNRYSSTSTSLCPEVSDPHRTPHRIPVPDHPFNKPTSSTVEEED